MGKANNAENFNDMLSQGAQMAHRFCKKCGDAFEPARHFHFFCWSCYGAAHGEASNEVNAHAALFDAGEIRWILQCVHPDKHKNSITANQVTVKLLQMRGVSK